MVYRVIFTVAILVSMVSNGASAVIPSGGTVPVPPDLNSIYVPFIVNGHAFAVQKLDPESLALSAEEAGIGFIVKSEPISDSGVDYEYYGNSFVNDHIEVTSDVYVYTSIERAKEDAKLLYQWRSFLRWFN